MIKQEKMFRKNKGVLSFGCVPNLFYKHRTQNHEEEKKTIKREK